jgi:hypothetical protein
MSESTALTVVRTRRFPAPDEAMEEHSAIIGKTGAGKTYTAKGFAEDLLAEGARFAVIDPTGVWWGLKSSADGEREGFPVVVFGGDHGDVELDENDGEAVAAIIATTATPCVIDVSGFPSRAATNRFMTDLAEHLFRLNREALHLFVDEADAFMPQKPQDGEQLMLNRWDTIARRGRSRGFRLTLISQRPAVLNKNALSQVGTLIALKLTSPQDRKALGDWIEGNADRTAGKTVVDSLPTLARGEGWVWSPGHDVLERVQFNTIETWDSSRTPGKGEIYREAKTLARADIADILAKMSTAHAQRPGSVRTAPDAETLKAARDGGHVEGFDKGKAAGIEEGSRLASEAYAETIARLSQGLRDSHGLLAQAVPYMKRVTEMLEHHMGTMWRSAPEAGLPRGGLPTDLWKRPVEEGWPDAASFRAAPPAAGELDALRERMGFEPPTIGDFEPVEPLEHVPAPETHHKPVPGFPALAPGEHRMAMALASRYPASLSRSQWGLLAKMAHKGGAFQKGLRILREAGFYSESMQRADASSTCLAYAEKAREGGPAQEWPSDFVMWSAHLPTSACRVLEGLRDLGGSATRSALAQAAGFAIGGGAFAAALKILHDNELLTATREGGVLHEKSDVAAREAQRLNRNHRR